MSEPQTSKQKLPKPAEPQQGPWWTPTLEVERLMRWCRAASTITVEISAKVLEGLLHDSLLWRQDRLAKPAEPKLEFSEHCGCCVRNKITVEVFAPRAETDEWKRLAADRNVAIGTLGQENERLKARLALETAALEQACSAPVNSPLTVDQARAKHSTDFRPTPSAWMRGVSSHVPGEPSEYDVEVVPDCDGPPDDGNEWIALYRRAEDVK